MSTNISDRTPRQSRPATDAEYAEMWAQDAAAMTGYATASRSASRMSPFSMPCTNTTPDGPAGQTEAVSQAANAAAGNPQSTLSASPGSAAGITEMPLRRRPRRDQAVVF
uniref:PPE domain-containing protein n=1 Tax=Mycobacterium tilburgii TaxID=44467 RepID=UPI0021B206A3|nr:hypothetical protein [Mycobacterium tilburgii]